jgi:NAD+ synthase (glutamine-hydrolysing)
LAPLNPLVGDIDGNTALALAAARRACDEFGAAVVVFPELVLSGSVAEDLWLRPELDARIEQALARLCEARLPACLIVGYPGREDGKRYNMLACIEGGELRGVYRKARLADYRSSDERRYFQPGAPDTLVLKVGAVPLALCIGEDLERDDVMTQARAAGARMMVNISAMAYHTKLDQRRRELLRRRAREGAMPLLYVNQAGGQDELVFDGAALLVDAQGEVLAQAPRFAAELLPVEISVQNGDCTFPALPPPLPELSAEAELYAALVLALRDYVEKNRFVGVALGLSGGIDSALTLALAVDALGPARVTALMMPYTYTAPMSLDDAEAQARALGVAYHVLPIAPLMSACTQTLAPQFSEGLGDITTQNLQARCRGLLLMAWSNQRGLLILTTSNKSEMAVGYSTLYGDMAGGFDVLKDVVKLQVYALARYRNTVAPVIPERVLTREPSAELAPDQRDADSLPPYAELDRIVELYVEQEQSLEAIIAAGFERASVAKVLRMVDRGEYKRRQAPLGVRVSERGFGRERRYPVTSGWGSGA